MKRMSARRKRVRVCTVIKRSSFIEILSLSYTYRTQHTNTLSNLRRISSENMKTGPVLQLVLIVTLLIGSSEEFFFEYPKKALMEFFQSLKTKKQPPKTNVQHYHVHYYPIPYPILAWRAPDKRDLETLYDDHLRSLGWSDYHYKYIPEPSIIVSSGLQHLWGNAEPWDGIWDEDILGPNSVHSSIDRNMKGILVQVPVNQQLVLHLLKKSQKQVAT